MKLQKDPKIQKLIEENDNMCLCKVFTSCPCNAWLTNNKCECGLYIKNA